MPNRCTNPDNLPDKPGVYIMRNIDDDILYVGKAKSLIKRVKSYFSLSKQPLKTRILMSHFHNLEYIITDTEKEALILESNLIKKHKPKYNIRLKDDKRYPYIKITNETFPRVLITRTVNNDKSYYYGPFTDTGSVRSIVKSIKALFKIRECKKMNGPCLNYQINLCSAPCSGKISAQAYNEIVEKINLFFEGKYDQIIEMLNEMMIEAANNQEFEKAAVLRDQILSVDNILEKQKIEFDRGLEQDVITCAYDEKIACVVVFSIRDGKIIGKDDFLMSGAEDTLPHKILAAFLKQYYMSPRNPPSEIIIQYKVDDVDLIAEWLSESRGNEVILRTPQNNAESRLVQMVTKNAEIIKNHQSEVKNALFDLKKYLNLKKIPHKIEAFDISNISGKLSVGSMVVFEEGFPKKSKYRKFKIDMDGPNDYAMMKNVLNRRYIKLFSENDDKKPDLILVDGGKGQLNVALDVLKSFKIDDIPIIGLAKEFEHIFVPEISTPLILPRNSAALHLLQRIRDEAHRFAVSYHKKLRSKEIKYSLLDEIKGIGEKRKLLLLKHFGDIEQIKNASIDEIRSVNGISSHLATEIHKYLHKNSIDKNG
ncbi:MAG: excinuclease ABC subunit UvrC [Methanobacterium sp.]|uniref:excinuclease ABC subunit UvrC n=1 Tax=Methanobacterium sp. TaxID=2164 RepID=UPI003D64BF8C|nr:excinuclease ABC subunit UvrC [Methanobacterium sp.]